MALERPFDASLMVWNF